MLPRPRPQMLRERPLQMSAEGVRRLEDAVRRPERQETVRIDRLQPDTQSCSRRPDHPGQEKRGELVGDHHAGACRQRLEEAAPRAGRSLHVRVVQGSRPLQAPGVVRHAVQHEPVKSVAGPGVVATQRLQDDQRPTKSSGPVDRPLQREVPVQPPVGDHPVEDEVAVVSNGCRVAVRRADLGNRGHRHLSSFRFRGPPARSCRHPAVVAILASVPTLADARRVSSVCQAFNNRQTLDNPLVTNYCRGH